MREATKNFVSRNLFRLLILCDVRRPGWPRWPEEGPYDREIQDPNSTLMQGMLRTDEAVMIEVRRWSSQGEREQPIRRAHLVLDYLREGHDLTMDAFEELVRKDADTVD